MPNHYIVHKSEWIVFTFQQEDHKWMVLRNGLYSTLPWVLKEMSSFFAFDEESFNKISTTIPLSSLPMEFWNARCLGKTSASKMGKPIAIDVSL